MDRITEYKDDLGWTLRWRKRWRKGYHKDPYMWLLMDYFIDFANHVQTERYIKGYGNVKIERGEHLYGTLELSRFLGITRQKLRSEIEKLKKIGFLTIKTTNRFSIIKVINYNTYQPIKDNKNHQNNQPTTSQQPANNQPTTTPKELKELKETSSPQKIINAAIEYLNKKAGVDFSPNNYITQTLLIDRIDEGATLKDIKLVIDKKCSQWINDARMVGNLRPSTLFAADKFEGYLQEAKRNGHKKHNAKLNEIELLGFGYDVLTKFGEVKFNEFCAQNNMSQNDIELIKNRANK